MRRRGSGCGAARRAGLVVRSVLLISGLVGAALVMSGRPVVAQATEPDAAALVAAQDLVLTLGLDRQLNQIIALVAKGRQNPEAAAAKRTRFLELLAAKLPLIRQETAMIYARRFTTAELIALTAFFRAGAGARFLEFNGELQKEATLIGLKFAREALAEAEQASK